MLAILLTKKVNAEDYPVMIVVDKITSIECSGLQTEISVTDGSVHYVIESMEEIVQKIEEVEQKFVDQLAEKLDKTAELAEKMNAERKKTINDVRQEFFLDLETAIHNGINSGFAAQSV